MSIAWGKRVTYDFQRRLIDIAIDVDIPANHLMACMAFETGRTFKPDILNLAGSGAVGLIQFMPATARALGTNTDYLSKLSAEDQLFYVHKYFLPYRGKLRSLEDVYMAILWPRAIGQSDDYVLFDTINKPTTYRQNASLDFNKDGQITKWEATARVRKELELGFLPDNFA